MKTPLLLALLLPALAGAADDCTAPSDRTIATIDLLPAPVRALLGRDEPGIGGVADAGEAFNPSHIVSVNPPLRMRRFLSASAGTDCYAITLEQGGIAHWYDTTIVRRQHGAWRVAGTRVPEPSELGPRAQDAKAAR